MTRSRSTPPSGGSSFRGARNGGYAWHARCQAQPHGRCDDDGPFLKRQRQIGEEASTGAGTYYIVDENFADIDAEVALAGGGGVRRQNGKVNYAVVRTTEKQPPSACLIARLATVRSPTRFSTFGAVEKVAMWDPPMRFNDATRYYFEKYEQPGTGRTL